MYRIRFHGRGGQGIKTASRILGSAFFRQGFEVQDAPRYGAERRGAPIFAYVRAASRQIDERGIIRRPDLVVVADDSLVALPAAGVLAGVTAHSLLLINTREHADTWRERLNFSGPVLALPVTDEAEDRSALRYTGAGCAGAAARLAGVIERQVLGRAIEEELAHLSAEILHRNRQVALSAYDLMAEHSGQLVQSEPAPALQWSRPEWVEMALEPVLLAAPTIHGALTSERQQTGLWRTMRPVIDDGHCNRCWWVCSTFCPDNAIEVQADGHPRIDYDHCKGCLVCVAQCPPHAIGVVPEHLARRQPTPGEGV